MLTLTLKETPHVPLEAETITPDAMAGLSLDAVRALPAWLGKRQVQLSDFFDVAGEPGDQIEVVGDAGRVKWMGRGMTRGKLMVRGNAGMHTGAYMKGGTIEVTGNAHDWLGGEMAGGLIRVAGNAGGQVGAAYRGSLSGMKEGTILVGGTAGLEVGLRMKRGTIVIGGLCRDFAGLQMKGGTLVLLGGAEIRTGAWMARGTIISVRPIRLMPTFAYSCEYSPAFLRLYARHLQGLGVTLPTEGGTYQRYTGDTATPGKGELLLWRPA